MSVTVDHQPLAAESLGLLTVGQVLAHLQQQHRLVVNVLIDGIEPNLNELGTIKRSAIMDHTLFIETAEPREMAVEVLEAVEHQLDEADRLKEDTVESLRSNQTGKAMEKLSGCFTTWQHAEESIGNVARLLRIDLSRVVIDGSAFSLILRKFGEELRAVKTALENRDFVGLCDTLAYEMTETGRQWRLALQSIRSMIE